MKSNIILGTIEEASEKIMYAYIIEKDSIVTYDSCVTHDWYDKHPEDKKWHDDNDIYIGSGYILYYDYLGNLLQSPEKHLFYKFNK